MNSLDRNCYEKKRRSWTLLGRLMATSGCATITNCGAILADIGVARHN
jgi:hypothetical protein